jgi:hypothetical protein
MNMPRDFRVGDKVRVIGRTLKYFQTSTYHGRLNPGPYVVFSAEPNKCVKIIGFYKYGPVEYKANFWPDSLELVNRTPFEQMIDDITSTTK